MGPRRSGRVMSAVVKTRMKVLQETVEVSVVERDSQNQAQETVTEEAVYDEEPVRTIPVDENAQTAEAEGTQKKETEAAENAKELGKRRRGRGSRRGGSRGGGSDGYKRYLFRVLKQVHPGMAISGQAMVILNNLMNDMFERLADEATRLSKYIGGVTLSSREIQGAVRLVLPGELGRHAIAEGAKAVTRYVSNKEGAQA